MDTKKPFYLEHLKEALASRLDRNPRYSMRSFATFLEIDIAALSRILSGKQRLAIKAANKILPKLELSPYEQDLFIQSVVTEKVGATFEKVVKAPLPTKARATATELDNDTYRIISDLHHYAILELTRTDNFVSDLKTIAKRLGITTLEAQLAIDRLTKLGLLRKENGRLVKTSEFLSIKDKRVTSPAQKKHQKQILSKAYQAQDLYGTDKRITNSIMMPANPERLELARAMITEFCRSISNIVGEGEKTTVYQMQVNLFPIEKEIQK